MVERKIELTFVKLGAAITVCGSLCRTKNGTNVRKIRRRVLRYVAVDDKYNYNIAIIIIILVGECSAFLASGSDPTMLCTICLLRT